MAYETADKQTVPEFLDALINLHARRWSERGLNYWAVSDLGADELTEFGEKFEAAMRSTG